MSGKEAGIALRIGQRALTRRAKARDEMSREEFDARMSVGLRQAKANQSGSLDEVFGRLFEEIEEPING